LTATKPGIFEQQRRFIQESGVVTAMVGLLNALPGTRLFARLTNEGRLIGTSTGNNVDAILNFIPTLDRTVLTVRLPAVGEESLFAARILPSAFSLS